jgi:Zn-dependent protease
VNLKTALILLPGLRVGLTIHEFAHAITAKWLGDRTAERMGRVSLNPLRHLSPLGTVALFILGFGPAACKITLLEVLFCLWDSLRRILR